ncbi:Fe-S cluster assembly protein IscX [Kingella oralis]|uniref:Fe-S cluster assembly protein IscX n=1 Tax=Kingella oralis TaxID=505 RepID=UPI0034E45C0B
MKWTDIQRIAEELYDTHGDSINPATVRFTQLRDLILALPDFDDDPKRSGEKILEAVQQAWLNEAE